MDERVFGRHEYGFWFRAVVTAGLLVPFVFSAIFLIAGSDYSFVALAFLLLGFIGIPLIFRYNYFSLTVSRDEVCVESWRKKIVIAVEDIVEIKIRRLSSLESAHIRDSSGNKFSFEHDLKNYEHVLKFLRERSLPGRRQEDQNKAIGIHRYRKSYLALLNGYIAFGAFIMASALRDTDLDSRIVVIVLVFLGALWFYSVVRDMAFQLKVDEDGVQARRFGSKQVILFTNVEKIEGGDWSVTLSDSSKQKIGFSRFLENYGHIKEYVFRACQAGKVTPLEDLLE